MTLPIFPSRFFLGLSAAVLLAACAGGPPPPDWQMNAKSSLERSVTAYLTGDIRVETLEFERARSEIARTGRIDLLARAELTRCAGRIASLVLDECTGFEKLRQDADDPERAYADFLAGRIQPQAIPLLPQQYRVLAGANSDAAANATWQEIKDPLSKLIAAGVLLRTGRAAPSVMALSVDTASSQGWRRPLLGWLGIQALRAEQAGDASEAQRLRRRIEFVQGETDASRR